MQKIANMEKTDYNGYRHKKGMNGMKKVISMMVCLMMMFSLNISNVHGETVYESDYEQARIGNVMLKLSGHRSTLGNVECLKQLNLMRYRACRNQEVNPDDKNKEKTLSLITDYGNNPTDEQLSKSNGDYVPLKWSNELERIAEIRSVEASICYGHKRPNSVSYGYEGERNVLVNGKGDWAFAENLVDTDEMQSGIDSWYSERSAYLKNPKTDENTVGHYENMIAPSNEYIALSTFEAKDLDGKKVACTVFEGGNSSDLKYFNGNDCSYTEEPRNLNEDCAQKVEVALSNCKLTLHVDDTIHPKKTSQAQIYAEYSCPFDGIKTKWPVVSRVLWSSTDQNVFKVDTKGHVTAGGNVGDAELQALVNNKLLSKSIQVGHTWVHDEKHTDSEATCVSEGRKYFKCSVCGAGRLEITTADPNAHGETELKNVKEATCTEDGYTGDSVCTLCGKVVKSGTVVPALGHQWVKDPTGNKYVCSRCGAVKSDTSTTDDSSKTDPNSKNTDTTDPSNQKNTTDANDSTNTSNSDHQDENTEDTSSITDDSTNRGNGHHQNDTSAHTHSYKWIVDQQGNSLQECAICGKKVYPQVASLLNLTLKASSNKMNISFKKVNGASQYTLYRAINGTKFKKYKTLKTNRFTDRKLKKHTIYGYMVMANDGKKTKSLKCYSVTGNSKGKQANVRNLTTSKTVKIKAGQKKKLKVKISYYGNKKKPLNKQFGGTLRYATNMPAIVKVDKNGTVTGIRKGHAMIYVYGQNGFYKSVKITVA